MAFFSKKKGRRAEKIRNEEVKVEEVKVEDVKVEDVKIATTNITSSYDDGSGLGPRCVKWYFLVHEIDGKYYEIFSNKRIKEEVDTNDGVRYQTFNTPYIEKVEPLREYLKNPNKMVIDVQLLFDFVLIMNVQEQLRNKE